MATDSRKLRNEIVFRDANERIRRTQRSLELDGPLPFVCECWDETCTAVIGIAPSRYEAVRGHERQFLIAPGHDDDGETVLERHDSYWVVEK